MSSLYEPVPRRRKSIFGGNELDPNNTDLYAPAVSLGPTGPSTPSQTETATSILGPATNGTASAATMQNSSAPTMRWTRPPPTPRPYKPVPEMGPVDRLIGPNRAYTQQVENTRLENFNTEKMNRDDRQAWEDEQKFGAPGEYRAEPGIVDPSGNVALLDPTAGTMKAAPGFKPYQRPDQQMGEWEYAHQFPEEYAKSQTAKGYGRAMSWADFAREDPAGYARAQEAEARARGEYHKPEEPFRVGQPVEDTETGEMVYPSFDARTGGPGPVMRIKGRRPASTSNKAAGGGGRLAQFLEGEGGGGAGAGGGGEGRDLGPADPSIPDGKTATNPKTGKRIIKKNGRWRTLKE